MHDDRIRETELACSWGEWHNYPVKSEGKQLRSSGVAGVDFAEKPFSDEKLGGALLAAPEGVRDASGSRKRLPSRGNLASAGFHQNQESQPIGET
jgi:hypothetical protein